MDVAVKCANPWCGKTNWYPPSVALRRVYCCNKCYHDRPRDILADDIIRQLGGFEAVSTALDLGVRRVRAWVQQGIPPRHHLDLLALARRLQREEIVTRSKLAETAAVGRANRARSRKAKPQGHHHDRKPS